MGAYLGGDVVVVPMDAFFGEHNPARQRCTDTPLLGRA